MYSAEVEQLKNLLINFSKFFDEKKIIIGRLLDFCLKKAWPRPDSVVH